MPDVITTLNKLIDPEVMADMITGKIPKKIRVIPFAKVDATLEGQPGSTITVPSWGYIGDAYDVDEGADVTIEAMSTSSKTATIKKAMKGVSLTDEAVLSGYGNPVGEAANQLALSIAAKVDNDAMDALRTSTLSYDGTSAKIAYNGIVDAIDVFEEEVNTEKVLFVHPAQVTTLRKDSNFISADKYKEGVMLTGEIGMIANTRIVPSKKVVKIGYIKAESGDSGAVKIVDETATPSSGESKLSSLTAGDFWDSEERAVFVPEVNDYVVPVTAAYYLNPSVKLEQDDETEDALPAITVYLKRETNVETERKPKNRTTEITADRFYVVALSNESKVVLAKFKA